MSKNYDRYKEDYTQLDVEDLEEVNTERFEKFKSKKKSKKAKQSYSFKSNEEEND